MVIARLVEFGANAIVIQELPCIVSPTLESKLAFDGCSVLELTCERESARDSEAVFFSVLDHSDNIGTPCPWGSACQPSVVVNAGPVFFEVI